MKVTLIMYLLLDPIWTVSLRVLESMTTEADLPTTLSLPWLLTIVCLMKMKRTHKSEGRHEIKSMVRFAWWAAEEHGLLGSKHYVSELKKNETDFKRVVLNLNFDMTGNEPNFA